MTEPIEEPEQGGEYSENSTPHLIKPVKMGCLQKNVLSLLVFHTGVALFTRTNYNSISPAGKTTKRRTTRKRTTTPAADPTKTTVSAAHLFRVVRFTDAVAGDVSVLRQSDGRRSQNRKCPPKLDSFLFLQVVDRFLGV